MTGLVGTDAALTPASAETTATAVATPLPYATGPLSRLISWLEASAWRLWAFTIGLSVVLVAWAHAVLWFTGRLPVGTLDVNAVILVGYFAYFFPAVLIGRRIGRGAISAFWPATGWPETEKARWIYRFEVMPAREEAALFVIGLVLAIGAMVAAPAAIVGPEVGRVASVIALFPIFAAGYAGVATGIVLATRWLRLVSEIHGGALQINPFDRVPIYAFSRLTVYVGLVIVAGMYYSFALNVPAVSGNLPVLVLMPVTTVVSVGAFIVPLWGIHRRLVRAKEDLLHDVDRRTTVVAAELYARVDARAFDEAKVISDSLAGLTSLRERVAHVPTWPWPPQLLRGFITALLLPIVIYLITRVIGTVLTF